MVQIGEPLQLERVVMTATADTAVSVTTAVEASSLLFAAAVAAGSLAIAEIPVFLPKACNAKGIPSLFV